MILPSGLKKAWETGSPVSTVAPEACNAEIKLALSSTAGDSVARGSDGAAGGVGLEIFPQALTTNPNIISKTIGIWFFIKHLQIYLIIFHRLFFGHRSSCAIQFFETNSLEGDHIYNRETNWVWHAYFTVSPNKNRRLAEGPIACCGD